MSSPSAPPSNRHWVLLWGAFATFTIASGLVHAYGVFLVTFVEVFAWTRAQVSIAYSVGQFVSGVSAPVVGWLVDRLGPRRLILIGGTTLTLGVLGTSLATELWHVVVLQGIVVTLGANCLGIVVFVPVLSKHFVHNRGMAVAVVQSANGFARAWSAPASTMMIDGLGWRGAYFWQGLFMGVVLWPLASLFRGAGQPHATRRSSALEGWTLREAVRTRHFWLLFAVYLFTGLGSFLVALHQLAFAVDLGFDKLYAAWVLGMGILLSLPGVIISGILSDRIGRELTAIISYGTSILGVAFGLMITSPDQHLLLWLHAGFFGLTWGARGPGITAKTADLFPGPHLGTILGVITIGTGIGSAVGSWFAGYVFDVTGSYRVAFWLSIVSYLCGAVAFWAVRHPPAGRPGHREPEPPAVSA